MKSIFIGLLALFSGSAFADPVTIVAALTKFAAYITTAKFWAQVALLVVASAYTSSVARRKARKEAAAAKARYNASLEDRAVTVLSASPAWKAVYGRTIVGGDVVAMFNSDKQGVDDKGKSYTKKDGFKHLVIRIADHEVHAIHGALWGGVKIGPLSGIGNPTYSRGNGGIPVGQTATTGWATAWTETRNTIIRGDTKMPYKVQTLVSAMDSTGANRLASLTLSADGMRVTGPTTERIRLTYIAIREDFLKKGAATRSVTFTGSVTLPNPVASVTLGWYYSGGEGGVESGVSVCTLSPDGRTITADQATYPTTVSYVLGAFDSRIKFSFHTGEAGQTVDTYLNSIFPDKWTTNHRLDGKAYVVVTLDLEDQRFQGGAGELSFDVSGRLLWDPRISDYEFSSNNALVANDFLLAPWGYRCDQAEVNEDYLIVAANACDTAQEFKETDSEFPIVTTVTEPLYTFNGPYSSDESREGMLESIAESMAGSIVDSADWLIIAGVWTPPVRDLEDADLFGSVEVVQGDNGIEDTFNAVRGRYVPKGFTAPTDFTPYRNATLITADGEELYDNIEFPYTDSNARCLNLARIHTEMSRTGLIIRYPAKTRAWRLQIGDRVRVNGTDFAFTYKKFRVTDWQHTLRAPVELVLQEDEPETYDTIDTALADPTKDINLANPWSVQEITGVVIESGTEHLVLSDGMIVVRALVSWDEPNDPYVGQGAGRVVVQYKGVAPVGNWQAVGDDDNNVNDVYITNLVDGQIILVRVYAINSLGIEGPSTFVEHEVVGKAAPPSEVTGLNSFASLGVIKWAWDYPPDIDYEATEIRDVDANWGLASPAPLWKGKVSQWSELVSSAGTYVRYFRHVDTGGRVSANTASKSQVVTAGDLGPEAVNVYRMEVIPPSGTIYTDYRGVVSDFSTADARIRVLNQEGVDVTNTWSLTKTDVDVASSLVADELSVLSFDNSNVDSSYPGSILRVPCISGLSDTSSFSNSVSTVAASFVASGGPFPGTGYIQIQGSGGSISYVSYGPCIGNLLGFNTNWSQSMWIYLTQYTDTLFTLIDIPGRELAIASKSFGSPGQTVGMFISSRYFGNLKNQFVQYASVSTHANDPLATITAAECPLNTWHFVEATWSSTERKLRTFFNGVKKSEVTQSLNHDLAAYLSSTYTAEPNALLTAIGGGIPAGNNTYPFSNGRISDVNHSFGSAVNTSNYTVPSGPRNGAPFLPSASVEIEAQSGALTLNTTYIIRTTPSPKAAVQVVPSKASGIVFSNWDDTSRNYSQAGVSFAVLVNGLNDNNNWDMVVGTDKETAQLIVSVNYVTKTITVTQMTVDDGSLLIFFSNPNYPSQYYRYPILKQRSVKPAQTNTVNRTQINLAGDYNGVVTNFTDAVFQAVMREAGEVASGWSWSVTVTAGITYTHSSGLVTVTDMLEYLDQGEIVLTATKSGWATTTFRCAVIKTKLLLPSGAVVTNIPAVNIWVSDSQGVAVSANLRIKNDGTIDSNQQGGAYVSRGRWFNPVGATPGNSYSVFWAGAWYSLTSDFVLSISATGEGDADTKSGRLLFAATANKNTVLGSCDIYMYGYVTPGGA